MSNTFQLVIHIDNIKFFYPLALSSRWEPFSKKEIYSDIRATIVEKVRDVKIYGIGLLSDKGDGLIKINECSISNAIN